MKWDIEGVVINKKLFPCGASTEVEKSATSSGADNIATFTTNERKPLTSLVIDIKPSQEGSGDPSPSNVRPLISYDKVTAKIQKGTTKVKEVVSFGKSVYGLTGDITSGEFEETYKAVKISSLNWTYQANNTRFYTADLANLIAKPATSGEKSNLLCDVYKTVSFSAFSNSNEIAVATSGNIFLRDTNYTTKETFIESMGDYYLCYPLATPTALTTDPVTITTFTGEQTVRFDEKIPFTLKYLTLEGDSCDIAKQFLPLFYNKERRSL